MGLSESRSDDMTRAKNVSTAVANLQQGGSTLKSLTPAKVSDAELSEKIRDAHKYLQIIVDLQQNSARKFGGRAY
jgi:hypothetical protein